jgi:4-amino-4-deoxy-L-arabinose transferase-like glycosyltransferase
MPRRPGPRAEAAIWATAFLAVASLLVSTGFTSEDPDSALYAALSARLAEGPVSHWIAPEWWGYWDGTGLFREHPAGVFLLPTALGRLGVPAEQAAYVVGIAAGLASLVLMGVLVGRIASPGDARAALVLLQLMPVAFIFRVRANHEYPMLVCLLAALISLDGVRRSWGWTLVLAVSLSAALLIKGVFVVLIVGAAVLWMATNPSRAGGSAYRPLAACLASLAVVAAVAVGYDALYRSATGETFWSGYWQRQLGPLEIATPLENATALAGHALFYVSRLLWHPAPWSLALAAFLLHRRRGVGVWWRGAPQSERGGLMFALGFAALSVIVLSPSSRFAERYAFSATFFIGAAGVVVSHRASARLATALRKLDAAVPALPAVVWLVLMLLRLTVGPYLQRVSID